MTTNAGSDTALDASVPTTSTYYDGNGHANTTLIYNVAVGQAPLVINPTGLPYGFEAIRFNIANIDSGNPNYVGSPDNQFNDQYKLSLQYGQASASLIATSLSTGAVSTIATVNDVATVQVNGQWEPENGPLTISSLISTGLPIDTGPHILVDQSGGATSSQSLTLSGNVVSSLEGELFNFADGEVVSIADNGVQAGSATIHSVNIPGSQRYLGPNDTAWTSAIDLVAGDNQISITTTDRNGLSGTASLDYVYTPPGVTGTAGGTTSASSTSSGGAGTTGGGSGTPGPTGAATPADSIALDSTVTFMGHGAFELTGHAASAAGVGKVELTAQVNGVATDLGAATVNADGSFSFTDRVGRNTQGFITATLTDGAGQGAAASADYALQAGLTGGTFVARQATYDLATGEVASVSRFRADGSRVTTVREGGQTLTAAGGDIFQNGGQPGSTFVFNPGFGQDVVQLLRAGGADHDTLSLPASDFTSIADVLAHTSQYKGTAIIQDPVTGDVLRLPGVSKGVLTHNSGVLSLHA